MSFIIRHYTREAGVRSLERQIGTICRKQARRIAEGKLEKLVVTREVVHEMLGGIKVRVDTEIAERTKRPGVVVGLAWTPTGGDILFVEAMKMKGKGEFKITGQIQDVMRESMQAALSWVRSNATSLGIDEDFLTKNDLHIHVPAGAIPKDGPSAGVTIATALVSLLDRAAGSTAAGHDRRDHAQRQRAADRRREGEVPGRKARRSEGPHLPGRQSAECGRGRASRADWKA